MYDVEFLVSFDLCKFETLRTFSSLISRVSKSGNLKLSNVEILTRWCVTSKFSALRSVKKKKKKKKEIIEVSISREWDRVRKFRDFQIWFFRSPARFPVANVAEQRNSRYRNSNGGNPRFLAWRFIIAALRHLFRGRGNLSLSLFFLIPFRVPAVIFAATRIQCSLLETRHKIHACRRFKWTRACRIHKSDEDTDCQTDTYNLPRCNASCPRLPLFSPWFSRFFHASPPPRSLP